MGAVTNMAPNMASVVIAGVPFVDVMTTMCDPTIPLTISEWEEWVYIYICIYIYIYICMCTYLCVVCIT
jgi:protease II